MDYKKYYKSDYDGCYSVHFKNTSRYSVDEIKEIFSKFGKVVAVNVTSYEDGLRFVRFKTIDEIKNCLDGLKDSNKIVILPERKVYQNKKMHMNSSQKQIEGSTDEESNGNFVHNKKFSETKFQKERSTYNTKISNCNGTDDAGFLDTDSRKISPGYKSNVNEVEAYDKQDVLVSEEKHLLPQKKNFDSSSSDGINYDKYYRTLNDGSYTIHFANKKKLSEEEITKIFSEYGTVLSINASKGDNYGLRFIRYKILDDVISCLKGLQNNNLINILPQKGKIIQADQKYSNQWQLLEDPPQKMFNNEQVNSISPSDETFFGTVGKETHNINTSDWDNESNNSFDIDTQNFRRNYKPNTIKHEKPGPLVVKTKLHFSTKTDGNTRINKNISDDNRTSTLNFDTEIMQKEFDVMSDCSLLSKDASSKSKVIRLQEIIVANIHENYGVPYILHLFEKYDPVSITFMKVISEINIRYCRVFFKTIKDAVAVEEKFDNYVLSGKNLIVLRESTLIEEAMCE